MSFQMGTGHLTGSKFPPIREVTYYQVRCTKCGRIEDSYGDFGAMADVGSAIDSVLDWDWFAVYVPTGEIASTGNPAKVLSELICPACQRCEVCNAERAYPTDDEEHLVCVEHDGHDFGGAA